MGDYENKMAELQKLRAQVSSLTQFVQAKSNNLDQRESLLKQSQSPTMNSHSLESNMSRSLGPMFAPGNLGDLNKILWPYYFSTDIPATPVGPNETFQTGFSITQEASYVWMSFVKAAYLVSGTNWIYLNPNQGTGVGNMAPGLTFTIRDGSSSRQFFNTPIELGIYGNPRFPSKFPISTMLMPNHVMQISFQNQHPTNTYVPFIVAFGYRIRIEDAERFLSLVYA